MTLFRGCGLCSFYCLTMYKPDICAVVRAASVASFSFYGEMILLRPAVAVAPCWSLWPIMLCALWLLCDGDVNCFLGVFNRTFLFIRNSMLHCACWAVQAWPCKQNSCATSHGSCVRCISLSLSIHICLLLAGLPVCLCACVRVAGACR